MLGWLQRWPRARGESSVPENPSLKCSDVLRDLTYVCLEGRGGLFSCDTGEVVIYVLREE